MMECTPTQTNRYGYQVSKIGKKMASEDWKAKLEKGELPPDHLLSEELLKKIGVGPSRVPAVLKSLVENGCETWGSLLDLENKEEAIKVSGEEREGKRI